MMPSITGTATLIMRKSWDRNLYVRPPGYSPGYLCPLNLIRGYPRFAPNLVDMRRIPLFVLHPAGIRADGYTNSCPCFLGGRKLSIRIWY